MKTVDFLDELGELALGSRLKRLSERLATDGAQVYKACGHDVQPKWFPLLALLHRQQQASVVDASCLLGLTQPAISQFAKELTKQGLIVSTPSKHDSRRKFLSLSDTGIECVSQMLPMWQAVDLAAKQLCSESGEAFFKALQGLEQALNRRSLMQRTMAILDNPSINPEVEIVAFKPEYAQYFDSVNRQWINEMFTLEDSDRHMLENPQQVIIDQGGAIYFAKHPCFGIIGTCALLNKGNSCFELTKMGVLPQARGLKIGETLLAHVVKQSEAMNVTNLFLLTNSKCEAAIHLYGKFGFVHDAQTMERFGAEYQRCDVAMRLYEKT